MKADRIGALASGAMYAMLSTTIKPGVIDRTTPGTRNGADYLTTQTAIRAASPWFSEIARQSIDSAEFSPDTLFFRLRKLGLKAEGEMQRLAGGVSVFKGSFFFAALCAAATGRVISCNMKPDSNTVCLIIGEMTQDICRRELETLDVKMKLIGADSLSRGERMYMKYGKPGARGEAENGLSTVTRYALPLIKKLRAEEHLTLNDIYVQTFMTLMEHTVDTGILSAENDLAGEEMQDRARGIIERGGMLTPIGREKIAKLDVHLRERKISPGASAALLTAAIFLHTLDDEARYKFL
ncbi:MAG: triphosphoribosyl-dephospho-CoA synthase [Clostridiales bacterium]|jgi:triphosphoribosyl-dephospho-CoA synthase|nr:triphosphoribosyl-dephospho-CoA synthase [Clostridiales bacterium]